MINCTSHDPPPALGKHGPDQRALRLQPPLQTVQHNVMQMQIHKQMRIKIQIQTKQTSPGPQTPLHIYVVQYNLVQIQNHK